MSAKSNLIHSVGGLDLCDRRPLYLSPSLTLRRPRCYRDSMSTPAGSAKPNRLIHETSPYLLQHALNPADWYPWGPEALQAPKAKTRPILLSVGYSACHWCHVMERESFENEAIASRDTSGM